MSLKAELETWAAALKAYDDEDFEKSLELFSTIGDSSKILTNMGLIYAALGEHEAAVEQFQAATQLDQYLAVAYFQCGVSNFLLQRYEEAHQNFEEALLYLRGNQSINYEQLGLKFKLYSAEVLFNKGLSHLYSGMIPEGMQDLDAARAEKITEEHNVIDDAIVDRGEGYTVFSIPVGVLYRPSENKLKNAKAKDYMGKAKLVATSDENEAYTTFTGVTRLKQGMTPSGSYLDGQTAPPAAADNNLSRAATVSVTTRPSIPDPDRPQPTLQRAMTTINVPADARERIRANNSGASSPIPAVAAAAIASGAAAGVSRSATTSSGRSMPPPNPVRGLSVRRPGQPTPAGIQDASAPPRGPPSGGRSGGPRSGGGANDFYDDYLDAYGDDSASPDGRTAAWAKNANGHQRARSVAPSSYAGGAPMARRGTSRSVHSRAQSMYEPEDEFYNDGYGDDTLKIRVKIHYQEDVRGMAIDSNVPFEEFLERVTSKFGRSFNGLGVKFKDEDGAKVTLRDESDYELAIETARESAKGKREGKLELWCTDV